MSRSSAALGTEGQVARICAVRNSSPRADQMGATVDAGAM